MILDGRFQLQLQLILQAEGDVESARQELLRAWRGSADDREQQMVDGVCRHMAAERRFDALMTQLHGEYWDWCDRCNVNWYDSGCDCPESVLGGDLVSGIRAGGDDRRHVIDDDALDEEDVV